MPSFSPAPDVHIHYEEHGEGFPILLIAPGGMKSAAPVWANAPWNPIEQLAPHYRVIAMDQRNAGRSSAPISGDDGWQAYTSDQLALLDHLGVERCHVAGMCIGGPYAFGLIEAAPARIASAVLMQPIGLDDNRDLFFEMFDGWANALAAGSHSGVTRAAWERFRGNMFDTGKLLFNLGLEEIRACPAPLLLLKGNDPYHPASTSEAIATTAPHVTYVRRWKDPEDVPSAQQAMLDFLARHTPA